MKKFIGTSTMMAAYLASFSNNISAAADAVTFYDILCNGQVQCIVNLKNETKSLEHLATIAFNSLDQAGNGEAQENVRDMYAWAIDHQDLDDTVDAYLKRLQLSTVAFSYPVNQVMLATLKDSTNALDGESENVSEQCTKLCRQGNNDPENVTDCIGYCEVLQHNTFRLMQ